MYVAKVLLEFIESDSILPHTLKTGHQHLPDPSHSQSADPTIALEASLTCSRSSPKGEGAGRLWFTKGLSAICVKGLARGAAGVLGAAPFKSSGGVVPVYVQSQAWADGCDDMEGRAACLTGCAVDLSLA